MEKVAQKTWIPTKLHLQKYSRIRKIVRSDMFAQRTGVGKLSVGV
jgi:hypothetical protein